MKFIHTTVILASCLFVSAFTMAECLPDDTFGTNTKPDYIYTVHVDGIVTDNETDLMWQKCSLGLSGSSCTTGSMQSYTWQAALKAANDNTDYGYSDWRLPNVKELASLIDDGCVSPSINDTVFPGMLDGSWWSATPYAGDGIGAWAVNFSSGYIIDTYKNQGSFYSRYVRLVRSIQ